MTRHLPGVSVDRTKDGTTRWHLLNGNIHNVPYDNDIILTNTYAIAEEDGDEHSAGW